MAEDRQNTEVRESLFFYLEMIKKNAFVKFKEGKDADKSAQTFAKKYYHALDDLENLLAVTDELYERDMEGENPKVSEEKAEELYKLYLKAIDSCEAYLSLVSDDANAQDIKPVKDVTALLKKDFHDISRADFKNAKSLPSAMEKARKDIIILSGDNKSILSGNASQRIFMTIDEQEGFFTAGKRYNYNESFDRIVNEMREYFGPNGIDNPNCLKLLSIFDEDYITEIRQDFNLDVERVSLKDNLFNIIKTSNFELVDLHKAVDPFIDNSSKEMSRDSIIFTRFLYDKLKEEKGNILQQTGIMGLGKGTEEVDVANKNCAMSEMDSLLGTNVLAKSSKQTIVNGPEIVEGVFMEKVKGFDLAHPDGKLPLPDDIDNSFTPEAIKQIYELEVIDFICGNTDRHCANLIYTIDDETKKITGIKGIDNDGSFHKLQVANNQAFPNATPLDMIAYIPSELAEKVKGINRESLKTDLIGYGLTNDEINAAWSRVQLLQEKINTNSITILKNDGWKNLKVSEIQKNTGNYKNLLGRITNGISDVKEYEKNVEKAKEEGQDINVKQGPKLSPQKGEKIHLLSKESVKNTKPEIENLLFNLQKQRETKGIADRTDVKILYDKMIESANGVIQSSTDFANNPNEKGAKERYYESLRELSHYAEQYYKNVEIERFKRVRPNSCEQVYAICEYAKKKYNLVRNAMAEEQRKLRFSNRSLVKQLSQNTYAVKTKDGVKHLSYKEKAVFNFEKRYQIDNTDNIVMEYGKHAKEDFERLAELALKPALTDDEKNEVREKMASVVMFNIVSGLNKDAVNNPLDQNSKLENYRWKTDEEKEAFVSGKVSEIRNDETYKETVRNINPYILRNFVDSCGYNTKQEYFERRERIQRLSNTLKEKAEKGFDNVLNPEIIKKKFRRILDNGFISSTTKNASLKKCIIEYYYVKNRLDNNQKYSKEQLKDILNHKEIFDAVGRGKKFLTNEAINTFLSEDHSGEKEKSFDKHMTGWVKKLVDREPENPEGYDDEVDSEYKKAKSLFDAYTKEHGINDKEYLKFAWDSFYSLYNVNDKIKMIDYDMAKSDNDIFAHVFGNDLKTQFEAKRKTKNDCVNGLHWENTINNLGKSKSYSGILKEVVHYFKTGDDKNTKEFNETLVAKLISDSKEGKRFRSNAIAKISKDILSIDVNIFKADTNEDVLNAINNHPKEISMMNQLEDFISELDNHFEMPQNIMDALKEKNKAFSSFSNALERIKIGIKPETVLNGFINPFGSELKNKLAELGAQVMSEDALENAENEIIDYSKFDNLRIDSRSIMEKTNSVEDDIVKVVNVQEYAEHNLSPTASAYQKVFAENLKETIKSKRIDSKYVKAFSNIASTIKNTKLENRASTLNKVYKTLENELDKLEMKFVAIIDKAKDVNKAQKDNVKMMETISALKRTMFDVELWKETLEKENSFRKNYFQNTANIKDGIVDSLNSHDKHSLKKEIATLYVNHMNMSRLTDKEKYKYGIYSSDEIERIQNSPYMDKLIADEGFMNHVRAFSELDFSNNSNIQRIKEEMAGIVSGIEKEDANDISITEEDKKIYGKQKENPKENLFVLS